MSIRTYEERKSWGVRLISQEARDPREGGVLQPHGWHPQLGRRARIQHQRRRGVRDLTALSDREGMVEFAKDDLAVVAAPSMGGRLPDIDDLLGNLKGDGTPAVVLASFGSRNYDDLLAQMKGILSAQGFEVIGGIAVVTSHVFSAKVGRNRPDAADREIIAKFGQEVSAKVASGKLEVVEISGEPEPEIKPLKVAVSTHVISMRAATMSRPYMSSSRATAASALRSPRSCNSRWIRDPT